MDLNPEYLKLMTEEEAKAWVRYANARMAKKKLKKRFNIEKYCALPSGGVFTKQKEFIEDGARFKTFHKSRRSGGTMALAGMFLDIGTRIPDVNLGYVTLDRGTAERIIWHELLKLIEDYGIEAKPNYQKLWIEFGNRSMLYMCGAKDRNEVNKLRGKAFYLVALDECQSFRNSIMEELVSDVLEASLIDLGGRLILVGTPNPARAGFFYDACRSKGYKHFHWTMDENPWLEIKSGMSIDEIRRQHLERKGIDANDPTYQREWCGRWIRDENTLAFHYMEDRDDITELPDVEWSFILGADIGFWDKDALVVWAFSRDLPHAYLVHAEEHEGEDVTAFASHVKRLQKRFGKFIKQVIDTGGLGKKVTEEIYRRHKIYFEPAEKREKLNFIKNMNDDFRQGMIKVIKGLPITEHWTINQFNNDHDPPKEDEHFSWDLTDAALLRAWREVKHYLYKPKEKKPDNYRETNQYADDIFKEEMKRLKNKQREQWWQQI